MHPSNFPRVTPHYMYHRPQHGRRTRFLCACASIARRKRPRFPRKRNTQIALALAISIDDLDRLSTS